MEDQQSERETFLIFLAAIIYAVQGNDPSICFDRAEAFTVEAEKRYGPIGS